MDIIVDANVLFSVLIKDSFSYNLLFSGKFHLFTPEYIFTELEKHKEEILEKTERTTEEFFRLIETLKEELPLFHLRNWFLMLKNQKKLPQILVIWLILHLR